MLKTSWINNKNKRAQTFKKLNKGEKKGKTYHKLQEI
jgi:hypothetical protein